MRLWVDAQLSPSIAAWIRRTFSDIEASSVRALGLRARMLHESALELARYAPPPPESATREELRAVAADLRHAQGFLAAVARGEEESELAPADAELAALAARQAQAARRSPAPIRGRRGWYHPADEAVPLAISTGPCTSSPARPCVTSGSDGPRAKTH